MEDLTYNENAYMHNVTVGLVMVVVTVMEWWWWWSGRT